MPGLFYTSESVRAGARFGWRDVVIFLTVVSLLLGAAPLFRGMHAPFSASRPMEISLAPTALPYYAARSLLRMFIAFIISILFTLIYGYVAAYNRQAEKVMIPLLDVLQSVPVLGFLSVTVTGFMALFPNSLMGLECASIFAIFTGQAWNMTFSFYQSLRIIPVELREASTAYQLNGWQRFVKLELPFSMIGLVWNSMMSFGEGWFFLAASEAISVLNQNYKLPGIGSYMAAAVDRGDLAAVIWAIVAMTLMVVLVDQLFWRPVVAWSQKFKLEQTESQDEPTSFVLDLLRQSTLLLWVEDRMLAPLARAVDSLSVQLARRKELPALVSPVRAATCRLIAVLFLGLASYAAVRGIIEVRSEMTAGQVFHIIVLGFYTLVRVLIMLALATIVWTPIGVRIGFSPRLARIAQPLVQLGASFPANLLFPVVTLVFVKLHANFNVWSTLLIALGTQWYVLFNVIAGASAVPGDLREAAMAFRLKGWQLWRSLILPAIFPAWVTGALTAAGGAWNASIVAEVTSWGSHHLEAAGLGAYIARATEKGDWPGIVLGIVVMSAYVVILNRAVWRRLYALAENRYQLG